MKKKLNEQTPSSADCSQLQSVMDPNMYQMVCDVQCSGNIGGFGNNIALLNIASCCECPEPVVEPTPGQEGPCRRIMDDIIPNEYNSTPEDWCKKNCKDVNSIVMINYGNDQVNGCKCCGNLDQVGLSTSQDVFTCNPGTQYSGGAHLAGFQDASGQFGGPFPQNVQNMCGYYQNYQIAQEGPPSNMDNANFQQTCCTEPGDQLNWDPYNVNESLISESLIKRFKKLANIKKRK